jgi:hypothetical protein
LLRFVNRTGSSRTVNPGTSMWMGIGAVVGCVAGCARELATRVNAINTPTILTRRGMLDLL